MAFPHIIGDSLLTADGQRPTQELLANCTVVAFCFPTHSAAADAEFTQFLDDCVRHSGSQAEDVRIIVVPRVLPGARRMELFQRIPTAAISSVDEKTVISKARLAVSESPSVVFLGPGGEVIRQVDAGEQEQPPVASERAQGTEVDGKSTHRDLLHVKSQIIDLCQGKFVTHMDTSSRLSWMKEHQKTIVILSMCSVFLYVAFGLVYCFCMMEVKECMSKPLSLYHVYLTFFCINIFLLVVTFTNLVLLGLVVSDRDLKVVLYKAQGRNEEAQKEAEEGAERCHEKFLKLWILTNNGVLVLMALITLGWGIVCLVSAIDARKDEYPMECKDDSFRFLVVFPVNICCQFALNFRQAKLEFDKVRLPRLAAVLDI